MVVVTQVFYPDTQATGKLLGELCAALVKTGVICEVLAGFPEEERQTSMGRQVPRKEVWQGVTVHRGGLRLRMKRHVVWRLLGYLAFSIWQIWRLLTRVPRDACVLVVTNPPFSPMVVAVCSRLRGWRYNVLLHDIYPDGLVATGAMEGNRWIIRLWICANRWTLNRATYVLVLGRDMAELVGLRYGVPRRRIVLVPNWSPHWLGIEPKIAEETELWQRLDLPVGTFVVQYSGNMGLWHDIDSLVRAAAALRHEKDIVFLLIGGGRRKASAVLLADQFACSNIRWLPFQPDEYLGDTLACCHLGVVSQRAGLEGVAVPSKLYGILAAGRAVLAHVPEKSETALVVWEEECGRVIPPGDSHALSDAIKTLARDRELARSMGRKAFNAYRTKYTLTKAIERLGQAL